MAHPSIVDRHIKAAKCIQRKFNRLLAVVFVCDTPGNRRNVKPVCPECFGMLVQTGLIKITQYQSCALFGPSCADVWFESFGFVTLALMAWAGFVCIIVLNTVSFGTVDTEENL